MRLLRLFLFFFTVVFFSSCSITRRIPEGSYLLNKISVSTDDKRINTSELESLIRQKPNRRILYSYRFHLRTYNLLDFGKDKSFISKLKNTIGEAPVILDTTLIKMSSQQHLLYLQNNGFFHAQVNQITSYKKKKAHVNYQINAGPLYKINNISYNIEDSNVKVLVYNDTTNSLIKKNKPYNVDVFQKERERLTNRLKNLGYYNFSRDFITLQVDSGIGNNMVDVIINMRNPIQRIKDSVEINKKENHKRFIFNNIFINPQFDPQSDNIKDTSIVRIINKKKQDTFNEYNFILSGTHRVNPKIITQSIFFRKGRYFNLNDVEQTYKRLSELKNYRFINIQFSENKDTLQNHPYLRMLDAKVELTRLPVNSYDIATDVTNSGGDLGIAGNLTYQNKNFFKSAEIFSVRLKGALEVQRIIGGENTDDIIEQLPFNTIETGLITTLEIPKFLLPVNQENFPKYFKPKTTLNAGLNYQKRPDYTRYILNTAFGYEWRESSEKRHILNPIEINSVKITPDSSFVEVINSIKDKRLQLSYKDNLSLSLKYSFIFSSQKINKLSDFAYFRGNLETSGNLLRLASGLLNAQIDEFGSYSIFNIRYAQFVKFDLDYRYYYILNSKNSVVFRVAGGLGLPYKNMSVMPFDKSFYGGGANGLRAWKLYQLGPGSYHDNTGLGFYKTGEIQLEGNAEYRFDIYQYLKGALFVDAGNIWFREKNEQFPGAEFTFDNFYNEIAIGGGLGARLDFSFFIIRIDAAIPLRDPAFSPDERWQFNNLKLKRTNFNLGIGYPF